MSMMLFDFVETLQGLFSIIPKLLYFIVSCVLSLIDLCQVSFRKLAGLEPIILAGEPDAYTGDVVYKLIIDALFTGKYPAISTVFWSLIIIGVFMLFITSIIALLRLEYNPDKEKGNSKSGVVKNFFKAIFSFAIIPISCLFGMYLFNSLVSIVNKATVSPIVPDSEIAKCFDRWNAVEDSNQGSFAYGSATLISREDSYMAFEVFGIHIPTTSQPFSGIVFKACAYGSNRIRNNDSYYTELYNDHALGILHTFPDREQAANIIDTGFSINAKLKGTFNLNQEISNKYFLDSSEFIRPGPWSYTGLTSLSKYNVNAVFYFYDLWSFNYIIAFVAVLSIGKTYYSFLLFLMQRFFEIIGLFVSSPFAISLMPLDGGEALKTWRTLFVSKFILLVIMVGTLNLISPLISLTQNIQFFGIPLVDYILLTFFIIAAFNAADALNKMLGKIFTGDDKAFEKVGEAGDKISGNFSQGLKATMSAARLAAAPITLPARFAGMGIKAGVSKGMDNRRERINKRLDKQQRGADDRLQSQLQNIEKEGKGYESLLNNVAQDQQTLNQFNNETGGFLERNDENDEKMLKAYKKSHFVGKRNDSKEVTEHMDKLKTDEAYKQQILDEMYYKENNKRFSSFYKDDKNLSQAENDERRAQMYGMLKLGQSDLDDRRTDAESRQAKFETDKEKRIRMAREIHEYESSKIKRMREAPEKRKAGYGKVVNKTGQTFKRFGGDLANLANLLPGSGLVSGSSKEIFGKKKD